MKPLFLLTLSIIMAICATLSIFVGMAVLDCNRTNFILITAISTMGYLVSFLAYDYYKTDYGKGNKE